MDLVRRSRPSGIRTNTMLKQLVDVSSFSSHMSTKSKGRSDLVVSSRLRDRRASCSNPDSTEDPQSIRACGTLNHAARPPVGVVRMFEKGILAQVTSSSSDRGSELRGPS
ncbi:hypothetical protein AVEN_144155-1 [Araneus ventricosus]|uniref:Uncharacterized protein n=1 Tax=Araneus ventricosus TaxID=182803 RepID=A0A4Y2IDG6_ARAVE|nr:hypothetical protein AVEN_144155-1 [Araneus ventricosus]